jgi:hypothetical protein
MVHLYDTQGLRYVVDLVHTHYRNNPNNPPWHEVVAWEEITSFIQRHRYDAPLPAPDPSVQPPFTYTPRDLGPGDGYTVPCADGSISHSGGIQGACSHHGGVG